MAYPSDQIFCAIRRVLVKSTPEERVRQKLVHFMISKLEFPRENLALEVPLKEIIKPSKDIHLLPDLRVDLVSFVKDVTSGELFPLIIFECKALHLNPKAMRQLFGYHHLLQSPFIGMASHDQIRVGWKKRRSGILSNICLLGTLF